VVECAIGSRGEVPGERKLVIRDGDGGGGGGDDDDDDDDDSNNNLHAYKPKGRIIFVFIECLSTYLLTYLLIYLFIPWCRILFEKLIVTHLVKNILISLWNPKVLNRIHKNPPLVSILNQLNPFRSNDPCLPKVHLNVVLPPTPRSSQWSLTFGPPNQNPINTSPLPHPCHVSRPPHPS
jgi:hypothetical protein